MDHEKKLHVVVATGEWDQDNLRYRRHRLAEYLADKPDTTEVIWVCPSVTNKTNNFTNLVNGIKQFTINDLHPNKLLRFGRYFDIFYRSKLVELRDYLLQQRETCTLCLWITFPGFPGMLDLMNWDRTTYDCSDLWGSSISGSNNLVMTLRSKSIKHAEARVAKNVDKIFCTSDFLHDNLKKKYNLTETPHVLENGVEYDLFQTDAKPKGLDINSELVLGFIGGIKPKLDFELLHQLMVSKPEWHLLLVGPDGTNDHPDFKQLINLSNVTWVGKVPPNEVPLYMNSLDIGILPYKSSTYNNAVFPLKLFEFLGSGKPVVGMNLPSTAKFKEENVYEYEENPTAEGFSTLCKKIADTVRQEKWIVRRKALAKEKDWINIFNEMYKEVLK
ncbi:glycosyltransferase [Sutcliffiella horikoshii]|uniref:glycosyltransferase n=1 Tax=Sutcliffiella horikoshii TaxID=79883 RepID=UPI003CF1ADEB